MKNLSSTVFLLVANGLLLAGTAWSQESVQWTNLLDDSLSQWEMYLGYKLPAGYAGEIPTDEYGDPLQPAGYNNNVNNVYSVVHEAGEPVLRISGEYYGSLFSKQVYDRFHLSVQVKWGEKKWDPRTDLLRDSGILYHSIGEHGLDYYHAWMLAQEFQVMEGHMGDYWSFPDRYIDIRAFPREKSMSAIASLDQPFLPFGPDTDNLGFCMRSNDYESPHGEWTQLDLIVVEDKSVHIVNGEVVMVLQNSRYKDGDAFIPLKKGKIQLQSEAAEVFYKDIKIRILDAMPAEYAAYFE